MGGSYEQGLAYWLALVDECSLLRTSFCYHSNGLLPKNVSMVSENCHSGTFWRSSISIMISNISLINKTGQTDGLTDLGRFKTLSLWLLKWFYYSLWREIFVTFYKSVSDQRTDQWTDGPTDQQTDTASYRDARMHLKMTMYGIHDLKYHE